jgi:hypothetical protein
LRNKHIRTKRNKYREHLTKTIWDKIKEIKMWGIWRDCWKNMKNLWQSIWDKIVDTDWEQMQIQSERTHTNYWPKPKKSSSSSPPHPLPPRRKSPPQMEKEKEKESKFYSYLLYFIGCLRNICLTK